MPEKRKRDRRKPTRSGPMQLTASSGYAIHGLAYLAIMEPGRVTFRSEISEHFAIPPSYLAKVFQTLARRRLVVSYRGAKGGYALARPANEITLREVIEIFEGPASDQCPLTRGPCRVEETCNVNLRLLEAQRAYLEVLDTHTIESISEEYRRDEGPGEA